MILLPPDARSNDTSPDWRYPSFASSFRLDTVLGGATAALHALEVHWLEGSEKNQPRQRHVNFPVVKIKDLELFHSVIMFLLLQRQ